MIGDDNKAALAGEGIHRFDINFNEAPDSQIACEEAEQEHECCPAGNLAQLLGKYKEGGKRKE